MTDPDRILFLCLGNICRSPAAEAIARAWRPERVFDSAGTGGWHVGEPPYEPMQAAARRRGYQMEDLRARQLDIADFTRFERIIAMDRQNLADARALMPAGATVRIELLLDHAAGGPRDVPDPYFTRDFDAALDRIEAGLRGLLAMP